MESMQAMMLLVMVVALVTTISSAHWVYVLKKEIDFRNWDLKRELAKDTYVAVLHDVQFDSLDTSDIALLVFNVEAGLNGSDVHITDVDIYNARGMKIVSWDRDETEHAAAILPEDDYPENAKEEFDESLYADFGPPLDLGFEEDIEQRLEGTDGKSDN